MDMTLKFRARLIGDTYAPFLDSNKRVLDIGCGNGIVGGELRKRFGFSISGTDIMPYTKVDMPFRKMEGEGKIPFEKDSFDVAMVNDVLHHMPFENQLTVIREGLRVSPLVLVFELEPTVFARYADWLSNKVHNFRMRIPFTFRRRREWEDFLQKNGLRFEVRPVRRPFYYPVSNYALIIRRGGVSA